MSSVVELAIIIVVTVPFFARTMLLFDALMSYSIILGVTVVSALLHPEKRPIITFLLPDVISTPDSHPIAVFPAPSIIFKER